MKRIGPGPAKYALPPTVGFTGHDYTRERWPMYSMAARFPTGGATVGPGAGKYNLEYKSRIGPKQVPAYMGRITVVPGGERSAGPGPGKYMLPTMIGAQRIRVWKEKSPDFVMAGRLAERNFGVGPGPCKYMLPDTMGANMKNIYANRQPQYTMAAQTRLRNYQVSPGPAKYDPRMKDEHRILTTMKGRHPDNSYSRSPLAKYSLADYRPGRRQPVYSMGIALSGIAQPMIVPGDNC